MKRNELKMKLKLNWIELGAEWIIIDRIVLLCPGQLRLAHHHNAGTSVERHVHAFPSGRIVWLPFRLASGEQYIWRATQVFKFLKAKLPFRSETS